MIDNDKNIGAAFRDVAQANRHFPAIASPAFVLDYGQLWALARSFAVRMQGHGVTRGALVAVNTGDTVVSVGMLLATALLGARMVVAGKLVAATDQVNPDFFFRSPEAAGTDLVTFHTIDNSWAPDPSAPVIWSTDPFEGYGDPEDPWLYLNTSGSTGLPKHFFLSQRVAFDRTAAIRTDFEFQRSCVASVLKCTARPFLARALGTLFNAGVIVEGTNLEFWRQAGVNLVFGPAHQVLKFLDGRVIEPKIRRVEVSGARLTPAETDELLRSFEIVSNVYGAGETNKAFATDHVLRDGRPAITSAGPAEGCVVEIVDDQGAPCPAGKIGQVRIANGYSIGGYLGEHAANRTNFRDGWFYPGDRASWGENGALEISGRADDVVNLGGLKLDMNLVDMVLSAVPGIRDAICFKNPKPDVGDQLAAYIQFEELAHRADTMQRAKTVARERLGVEFTPQNIHPITLVPRGEDGTPLRAECQRILLRRIGLLKDRDG